MMKSKYELGDIKIRLEKGFFLDNIRELIEQSNEAMLKKERQLPYFVLNSVLRSLFIRWEDVAPLQDVEEIENVLLPCMKNIVKAIENEIPRESFFDILNDLVRKYTKLLAK